MKKKISEMTQNEKIIYHLQRWGKITSLKAIEKYGILRLASRIHEIREMGYQIESDDVVVKDRWGKKCHVAEYRLME